jgi:hypothetical protein
MRALGIAVLLLVSTALVACGGSETTTVIKEVPTPQEETGAPPSTANQATERSPQSSAPSGEPPNVVGLPLPEARRLLKQTGYRTAAKNNDTTFGIIVPDNFTICHQGKPRGDLVVVLAQKYGC